MQIVFTVHRFMPDLSVSQYVGINPFQWRIQDFPWGGVDLVGGGVDSQGGYVSKILYVKMKELGPLGGARPLDLPMPLLLKPLADLVLLENAELYVLERKKHIWSKSIVCSTTANKCV